MILGDFPLKITIKLENLGLISYVFGLLFPNQSYYPKRTHLLSSKKSRLFIKVYCMPFMYPDFKKNTVLPF